MIVLKVSCFLTRLRGFLSLGRDTSRGQVKNKSISAANRPPGVIGWKNPSWRAVGVDAGLERGKGRVGYLTMWSRTKITAPILGKLREVVPHPPQSSENGTSQQARAGTTTENENDNIKIFARSPSLPLSLSLSLHNGLFLLVYLKRSTKLIICFLSSQGQRMK